MFALLSLILTVAAPGPGAAGYAWPLDLPRQLTSSFAEYRPGRFHAGIDLRTNGTGRDVRAADDGHISRVRCSPWGYGKAVYVQLADGHTAVYAHLDDYEDRLRAYVREQQHARQRYTVDLYPEPGQFPVAHGQVIAKSGQTGIGAPHLHYELRNAAQEPVNPRLLGVTWPDDTAPAIKSILVSPRGPGSRVNGDVLPVRLAARKTGPGQYACEAVSATGEIGAGVALVDPGSGGYRLGVRELALYEGETALFRMVHDKLSYDNHRNAVVSYHPYFLDEGRFLVLWRWPGNVCASYSVSSGDGWVAVKEARSLRIAATDFAGNSAVLTLEVQAQTDGPAPGPANAHAAKGRVDLDCLGNYLVAAARFESAESRLPEALLEGPDSLNAPPFTPVAPRTFRAAFVPRMTGWHTLSVTHPALDSFERRFAVARRGAGTQLFEFGALCIRTFTESPYGLLFLRAYPLADCPPASMRRCSGAWRVWPEDAPIDTPIEVSLAAPDGLNQPERVHLYRRAGGGWSRLDSTLAHGRFTARTRSLGTFALFEDTDAPVLRDLSPAPGYTAQTRRPKLTARIADKGSGIQDWAITCNGEWLLAEYDPEHGRMAWVRDEDLPAGACEVVYRVTDHAGNTATAKRGITIPGN